MGLIHNRPSVFSTTAAFTSRRRGAFAIQWRESELVVGGTPQRIRKEVCAYLTLGRPVRPRNLVLSVTQLAKKPLVIKIENIFPSRVRWMPNISGNVWSHLGNILCLGSSLVVCFTSLSHLFLSDNMGWQFLRCARTKTDGGWLKMFHRLCASLYLACSLIRFDIPMFQWKSSEYFPDFSCLQRGLATSGRALFHFWVFFSFTAFRQSMMSRKEGSSHRMNRRGRNRNVCKLGAKEESGERGELEAEVVLRFMWSSDRSGYLGSDFREAHIESYSVRVPILQVAGFYHKNREITKKHSQMSCRVFPW